MTGAAMIPALMAASFQAPTFAPTEHAVAEPAVSYLPVTPPGPIYIIEGAVTAEALKERLGALRGDIATLELQRDAVNITAIDGGGLRFYPIRRMECDASGPVSGGVIEVRRAIILLGPPLPGVGAQVPTK